MTTIAVLATLAMAGCQTTESGKRHDEAALKVAQDDYLACGGGAAARARSLPGDSFAKTAALAAYCEPKLAPVRAALADESRAYRDSYVGALKRQFASLAAGSMLGLDPA